jgi:hypothetical protein
MKNITYDELIKIAPKDRPFQIEVESNPRGEGGKQVLWAYFDIYGCVTTYIFGQGNIDGIDYTWANQWKTHYKGKFTLIDPRYQKPEVLKVGQKVRIMESARDCDKFQNCSEEYKNSIGGIYTIDSVWDDPQGVHYVLDTDYIYPHYAVMLVEEEEMQEIPELEGTLDQLSTLIEKAQEIVDKYQK